MGTGYSMLGVAQWMLTGNKNYGVAGFLKASKKWGPRDTMVDMTGRVVIVTGGNAGIGYATAEELARKNAIVHILCRNLERGSLAVHNIKENTGNTNVHLHIVNVADSASVRAFAAEFLSTGSHLDVLINNAGVLLKEREVTSEKIETVFATMMMQSYLLTGLLLPALKRAPLKPARVINVSSAGLYTVRLEADDLQSTTRSYNAMRQYGQVKRAQVMLSEMWAKRVDPSEVVVNSMHPGWADTPGLNASIPGFAKDHRGDLRTPAEGADTVVWMAVSLDTAATAKTGAFFFDREQVSTDMPLARTSSTAEDYEKLWRTCATLCGSNFDSAPTVAAGAGMC